MIDSSPLPSRPAFAACALGLAWFAGCTTPSSPLDVEERIEQLELPLAPAWGTAQDAGAASGAEPFWATFGEERLETLVIEALTHNRDLAASAARLEAAASRARVARSLRQPAIDATLGRDRRKNIFVGLPIPGAAGPLESLSTTWDVGLQASWEVDLWGRLASGAAAADASLAASSADHAAAQLAVAAQTTRAWFALREARLQLELAERTRDTYVETAGVIEDRFDAGLVGALDLRLADANVATSEAQLVGARRAEAVARRQMEVVLGRFPSAEIEVAGAFAELPAPVPAGLPAELLRRRPDLYSLERQLVSAERSAEAAHADRWPRIVLTGNAGTTSDQIDDLLDGDFTVWGLAARLTQPLFDGGRRRAAADEADALARAAGQAFAGGVLGAFLEVENALDAEGLLREQIVHLRSAEREASEALELADAQYREGLVGIELVLDSQRRLLSAESSRLAAQRELFLNRVDLHVALGGGFEAPEDGGAVAAERSEEER